MKNKPKKDKTIKFELKSNSVGSTDMAKNREKANCLLCEIQKNETQKMKDGYVWMINGKTSKLVCLAKIEESILNGFKRQKN